MKIDVNGVQKRYTINGVHNTVLHCIETVFLRGNSYCIAGASGSGKSTLLHIIGGIDSPDKGSVLYDGIDIAQYQQEQKELFFAKRVGVVFQRPYLLHALTVIENVMIKRVPLRMSYQQAFDRAQILLDHVGLFDKKNDHPAMLSGGQQQRVAVARALFSEPDFLLADEPTGSLDNACGKELVAFLQKCKQRWSMGMIISSHDPYLANAMDTVLSLKDGLLY